MLFGPHLNLLLQGGSRFLIIIFELAKRVVFGGVEQNKSNFVDGVIFEGFLDDGWAKIAIFLGDHKVSNLVILHHFCFSLFWF